MSLQRRTDRPGSLSRGGGDRRRSLFDPPVVPPLRQDRRLAGITGCFFLPGGPWPPPGLVGGAAGFSGARVRILPSRGKEAYHAACTVASNLMCALVQESVALLRGCGFSQRGGPGRIGPPDESQSGPSSPGGSPAGFDRACGARGHCHGGKHLACLTGEDARQVYRGASRMLVELARNKHPDIDAESMNEILKEGSNR